jgi:Family of unknown function (DUF6518)
MRSTPARRVAGVLVVAAIFGAAMAVLKGNNDGLRDAVGNASAPWLMLPFLAGAFAGGRNWLGGAVIGVLGSLAALTGFYFADSFVLDLGPHPWLVDLSLTMRGATYWAERALLSGPVFGALGLWWHRRRSVLAAAAVAAAFVLEPAAWWLYGTIVLGSSSSSAYPVPAYPGLWLGEIVVGIAGFALLARHARRREPPGWTATA